MMKLIAFFALIMSCGAFQLSLTLPKVALSLPSGELLAKKAAIAAVAVSAGLILLPSAPASSWGPAIAHAAEVVQQKSIFEGRYRDPNHPEGYRVITSKGKIVTITGSDNKDGSNPFTIMAKEDLPGTIFVDFSPKG